METLGQDTLTIINSWLELGLFLPPFIQYPDIQRNQKTLVKYGQWEQATDKDTNNISRFTVQSVNIYIPLDAKVTPKRKYIPYKKFDSTPDDQKVNFWTVRPDQYIFLGDVPEITELYTLDMAIKDFPVTRVNAINDLTNNDIIPHLEIIGI